MAQDLKTLLDRRITGDTHHLMFWRLLKNLQRVGCRETVEIGNAGHLRIRDFCCLKRVSIGGFYIFDKYIFLDNLFVFYIIKSL